MSNLGWYQTLTTFSKKVGGPLNLVGGIFGTGAVIGGAVVAKVMNNRSRNDFARLEGTVFTITSTDTDGQGLTFSIGEQYKVLKTDGDAILIEKIGDGNNPYYVSAKFLHSVSEFPDK